MTNRPYGTAADAIDYACDHIEDIFQIPFLEAWREGRLEDYPDYFQWLLIQRAGAREAAPTFKLGDLVTKKTGSSWTGYIVGTYSTSLNLEGYCVESIYEKGSVQVYPAAALRLVKTISAQEMQDHLLSNLDHNAPLNPE